MKKIKSKEWEIIHSSLALTSNNKVTYEDCRNYASTNIAKLTYIDENLPFISEIPKGTIYNFLVRVDTCKTSYNKEEYYKAFKNRDYISFSTYSNKNKSHYNCQGRKVLLAYNVKPDTIVHIFPTDSDIDVNAKTEESLTNLPSLWLTLDKLNKITMGLNTYNQVTCKTKQNGDILKPIAIIVEDKVDDYILSIAKDFNIKCIIVHPDDDAIDNSTDLYSNYNQLAEISKKLNKLYGFETLEHYHIN